MISSYAAQAIARNELRIQQSLKERKLEADREARKKSPERRPEEDENHLLNEILPKPSETIVLHSPVRKQSLSPSKKKHASPPKVQFGVNRKEVGSMPLGSKEKSSKRFSSNVNSRRNIARRYSMIGVDADSLAEHLRKNPNSFNRATLKIGAVGSNIGSIGHVQEKHRGAKTLFISHNSLKSLQGMERFQDLKILSANHNAIEDTDELEYLASLRELQNISLEGNPICGYPFYRQSVLARLPEVKVLDAKDVTEAERSTAPSLLKKEETMSNLMFSNFCLTQKLEHALSMLHIHKELRQVVFGRIGSLNRNDMPDPTEFNTRTYLRCLDIENDMTPQERKRVMNMMRCQVQYTWNKRHYSDGSKRKPLPGPDSWDLIYSEVMLNQQNEISHLLGEVEALKAQVNEDIAALVHYDPGNLIRRLRQETEKSEKERTAEREALIAEFRDTVDNMMEDFKQSYTTQTYEYEKQLDDLEDYRTAHGDQSEDPPQPRHEPPPLPRISPALSVSSRKKDRLPPAPPSFHLEPPSTSPPRSVGTLSPRTQIHRDGRSVHESLSERELRPYTGEQEDPVARGGSFYDSYRDMSRGSYDPRPRSAVELDRSRSRSRSPSPLSAKHLPEPTPRIPLRQTSPNVRSSPARGRPATVKPLSRRRPSQQMMSQTKARTGRNTPLTQPRTATTTQQARDRPVSPGLTPRMKKERSLSPLAAARYHQKAVRRAASPQKATVMTTTRPTSESRSRSISPAIRNQGPFRSSPSPPRPIPQVRAESPVRQEPVRPKSLSPVPGDDSEYLRRQIELLKSDIDQRVAAEEKLHNLNVRLRERLNAYQAQNDDNVSRAEHDLQRLQLDLSKSLAIQQSLEEQLRRAEERSHRATMQAQRRADSVPSADIVRAYEEEVEGLKERNEELYLRVAEYESVLHQPTTRGQEMRVVMDQLEKEEAAIALNNEFLQRKAFRNMREGIISSKIDDKKRDLALRYYGKHLTRKVFDAWNRHHIIALQTKFAVNLRMRDRLKRIMGAWRWYTDVNLRINLSQKLRLGEVGLRCWGAWQQYHVEAQKDLMKCDMAESLLSRKLYAKCFGAWRFYMRLCKLTPLEEKTISARCAVHSVFVKRKISFQKWAGLVRSFYRPRRRRLNRILRIAKRNSLHRGFWAFYVLVQRKGKKVTKKVLSKMHFSSVLLQKVFGAMKQYLKMRRVHRKHHELSDNFHRAKVLGQWKADTRYLALERRREGMAARLESMQVRRRHMYAWMEAFQKVRYLQAKNSEAISLYFRRLLMMTMGGWIEYYNRRRMKKRNRAENIARLKRIAFSQWANFARDERHFHVKCLRSERWRKDMVYGEKIDAFRRWVRGMRREKRNRHAVMRAHSQWARNLKALCFSGWLRCHHMEFKEKMMEFTSNFASLQSTLQEQDTRATSVNLENLQLIDRLHMLSSEIAVHKDEMTEKDKELRNYQSMVEDFAEIESGLKMSNEALQVKLRQAEDENKRLNLIVDARTEESTSQAVSKSYELQVLKEQIDQLNFQLQEKTQHAERMEKSMMDMRQLVDQSSNDYESKMSSAFDIASSLRSLVEEKDAKLKDLEEARHELEVQLTDARGRINAVNKTLEETVIEKDSVLEDLQNKLNRAQTDVRATVSVARGYQEKSARQERELNSLRNEAELQSSYAETSGREFINKLKTTDPSILAQTQTINSRENVEKAKRSLVAGSSANAPATPMSVPRPTGTPANRPTHQADPRESVTSQKSYNEIHDEIHGLQSRIMNRLNTPSKLSVPASTPAAANSRAAQVNEWTETTPMAQSHGSSSIRRDLEMKSNKIAPTGVISEVAANFFRRGAPDATPTTPASVADHLSVAPSPTSAELHKQIKDLKKRLLLDH